MTAPTRARAALLRGIAVVVLCAMVPVIIVVWIARHGAEDDAQARITASADSPGAHDPSAAALPPPPAADAASASIEGRVVTEAGAPVPGAWVCLLPDGPRLLTEGVAHALCAEDGTFSIGGLSAGCWLPHVLADGTIALPMPLLELDAAQQLRDVRLVVRAAAGLPGRVNFHDGSTSAGLDRRDRDESAIVLEGEGDDITLYGAPPEARQVSPTLLSQAIAHFTWPGAHANARQVQTAIGTTATVQARAGETTVVDIVVPRRALVRGRVLAGGEPVAGAVVRHREVVWSLCHLCASRHGPSAETATTGADGRFEQSIPYGGEIAFWAVAADGSRGEEVRLKLTAGTRFDVELALPSRRR